MAKIAPGPLTADIDAPAAAAIVAYTFVTVNGDTPVVTTATAPASNVGIALNSAAAGEGVGVKFTGVCPLICNGNSINFAVGACIEPTTAGHGSMEDTAGQEYNAIALQACTTDSPTILVRLNYATI